MDTPNYIKITDTWTISRVVAENQRRGDSTIAKTLTSLANERLVQLEEQHRPAANPSTT